MDKYKNLLSNTIIFAIGTFGSKLLSFVMVGFYTAVFSGSPGEFSTADLIAQTANFLIPIASFSVAEGIIRFGLERGSNNSTILTNGIFLLMCGLSMLTLLIPFVNLVTKFDGYGFYLYIYVYAASFKQLCGQFVRSRGLVKLYAFDGILTTFLLIGLNFLLLGVLKLGVSGYLLSIIIADVISILFLWKITGIGRYIEPRLLDGSIIRMFLRYCVPLIPTAILWIVVSISDRFFVAYMISDEANGIYTASTKIPMILGMASTFFTQAWQMSAITEGSHNNRREVARFYTKVFGTYQSLMYVAAGGILLFLKPLSGLLLRGESFSSAWLYSPMLVVGMTLMCFCNFLASVYSASKHTVNSMTTSILAAIVNIVLNAILIPEHGAQGAAFATMTSYLLCFLVRLVDTRRFVRFRVSWVKSLTNITLVTGMALTTIAQAQSQVESGRKSIENSLIWLIGIFGALLLVNGPTLIGATVTLHRRIIHRED